MDLMIYGSGSTGREIADMAQLINRSENRWGTIHFLDDLRQDREHYGLGVLKMTDLNAWPASFECVIAIGEPQFRLEMHQRLSQKNFTLATLIDPSARISPTAKIGPGCIVGPGSFVSSNTILEENVMLEINTIVGHDIVIGSHSVISSCTVLGGAAKIGTCSFIGLNCAVKERTVIGKGVVIGMQSAVYNDIPDEVIALGNPCRVLRKNESGRVFKPLASGS
ncbi:MAG: acetyltransferase [Curvibacter lanceolatus]|jgi:sugar O-acyltransferase (sialic acid O-acetyltransferase NeuD family)|uniref:acetyltransferase n=1 Tax=Curvibacter lanceolatus TaxID=86182 RepID=UPI00235592DD|nr:acetyltransferase [Curvibacter lanceolatus]MBV5293179.1 acetyltransferase [Curvibacter lanceolatus]